MLTYVNHGARSYGANPVMAYVRNQFEFQAILSGGARPRYEGPEERGCASISPPRLWVHGPDSRHGWTDQAGGGSRVAVLHFSTVSPAFSEILSKHHPLSTALTEEEAARFQKAAEHATRLFQSPGPRSTLEIEHILSELSLMAIRRLDLPVPERTASDSLWKVEAARTVYRERLRQSPTVEEVAREVGVSPSHLRRLFRQAAGQGPKQAFLKIRMEMARKRVEKGTATISEISEELGFSEPSAFSRAYKRCFGVPPRRSRLGG